MKGKAKMKIPEKLKIGGLIYDVKREEKVIFDNRIAYGKIDRDKAIIVIASDVQGEQGMKQTFLHEMLHGIAKYFAITELDENEEIIDKLAWGLHMVIADNPDMFEERENENEIS